MVAAEAVGFGLKMQMSDLRFRQNIFGLTCRDSKRREMNDVPTKSIIEWRFRQMFDLVEQSETLHEIEEEIEDRLSQLRCDVANRSAIERAESRT